MAAAKKAGKGASKGKRIDGKIQKLQGELTKLQEKDQKQRLATVSKVDLDVYYRVWSLFHHDHLAGAHATRCTGCHDYTVRPAAGRGRFAKLGG